MERLIQFKSINPAQAVGILPHTEYGKEYITYRQARKILNYYNSNRRSSRAQLVVNATKECVKGYKAYLN